ncbi:MAG: GMC family oxidoreductase, partial [Vicinamibacterales bacterium]
GAVTIQANQPWTSTGVTVRKGQTINLTTSGQVQLSDDVNDIADANGAKSGRMATGGTLRVPAGALIGRIGPNGTPFGVGAQTSIVAPAAGVLFLGVNDDGFADNKGNYQVVIR